MLKDRELPELKKQLLYSLGFVAVLAYLSIGYRIWHWPAPVFFMNYPAVEALVEMVLATSVLIINRSFFQIGFKKLAQGAPNGDTLVALGVGAAYVYGVWVFSMLCKEQASGNLKEMAELSQDLYFGLAGVMMIVVVIGKMVEVYFKSKAIQMVDKLISLEPKNATVIWGEDEVKVKVDEIQRGDIFLVGPGDGIPVDGIILEGSSVVDESLFQREATSVGKSVGDSVYAATVNQSEVLKCKATRVGENTSFSQMLKFVSETAYGKVPMGKAMKRVSRGFVPVVIKIALATFILWVMAGQSLSLALARGISVLMISSPCALLLAAPITIAVGSGVGVQAGVLFRNAAVLGSIRQPQIVAVDKEGTITKGELRVTDIAPVEGIEEEELLRFAASLEARNNHSLAKAIVKEAESRELDLWKVGSFRVLPGNGVWAVLDGVDAVGGSLSFMKGMVKLDRAVKDKARSYAEQGKTPLLFAEGERYAGMIAIEDSMKEDSKIAIQQLKQMGMQIVMLSEDGERTSMAIGKEAGVDEVIAGVVPEERELVIRNLQKKGQVAMVGNGSQIGAAFTQADIGIAIGADRDLVVKGADVILMKSSLSEIPKIIKLSRAIYNRMRVNLIGALFYNVVAMFLATGILYPVCGLQINPMWAPIAMGLAGICVVINGLGLKSYK